MSGEEPLAVSIPCSEDPEVLMLSSNSSVDNNNNTEAFEFSVPTSIRYPLGLPTTAACTSITSPTNTTLESVSSPVQVTSEEEHNVQSMESSVETQSLPVTSKVPVGIVSSSPAPPVVPPPPPPPPVPYKPLEVGSSTQIAEDEVAVFKADSSSDEEMEVPVQETIPVMQGTVPVQETMSEHFSMY